MNRRSLIKNSGLAALAAATPLSGSFARDLISGKQNAGHFRFKVGQLQLTVVTDGHALVDPAQPIFAPGINPVDIENILKSNFLPEHSVDIALNVLLLQKGREVILFDTGCGNNFGSDAGRLVANLRSMNVDPKDVTSIFLTHAHPDHIGGLADANGQPAFGRAVLHMARAEYDFWMAHEAPDFSKCRFPDENATASWIKLARRNLAPYKSRIQFFEDGDVLFGCVRTKIVSGHTPGHTMVEIFSGEHSIIHMADIAHDHVILLQHPEWGVGFDTDFEAAATARKTILGELADQRAHVFSYHLPWPGLGHIRTAETGFEWIARAISTP